MFKPTFRNVEKSIDGVTIEEGVSIQPKIVDGIVLEDEAGPVKHIEIPTHHVKDGAHAFPSLDQVRNVAEKLSGR